MTFNTAGKIKAIALKVKSQFQSESSGHDWWHIYRVWQMAKNISKIEKADTFVVELGALLHDIADWKFHDGDENVGPREARKIMEQEGISQDTITSVIHIIENISFKGALVENKMKSLEGKIVQDADRLDALGAIGVARAFAYGSYAGLPMHNPQQKPKKHRSKDEYFKSQSSTINHFYEKLLLLKERMNTKTGKAIALERHEFTQKYLDQFLSEWGGQTQSQ